jgi:hypothetical protein
MSLVKGRQEFRTILDFSKEKLSKNKIKTALRQVEVLEYARGQDSTLFIENNIKIGMYNIRLLFSSCDADKNRNRLKEYGGFQVAIYERNRKCNIIQNINLLKDKRFKNQYWTNLNNGYNIRMKNLIDIIIFTERLNKLRMFL